MSATVQQSKDQFLCSICLEVFKDPVTTSCGHNFCKKCITQVWDTVVSYKCPICKEAFPSRPELRVNTFIKGMVMDFQQRAQQEAGGNPEAGAVGPGEVGCDICTARAVKSCLGCLQSFCETHLQPHLSLSGLQRHQLLEPTHNLQERMCTRHDKPLELFCSTDQECVCTLCSVMEHKGHDFVSLAEAYAQKRAELEGIDAKIQATIQKKQQIIREIQQSKMASKEAADREKAEGFQLFTDLMDLVQKGMEEFTQDIDGREEREGKLADELIGTLEEEIIQLNSRRSKVRELSCSEDHLHVLRGLPSVEFPWPKQPKVSVPPTYRGAVARAVARLQDSLSQKVKAVFDAELKAIQCHEVDVELDPVSRDPYLVVSKDRKQVHWKGRQLFFDNPDPPFALGRNGFSSGQFYFQVQVKTKTEWTLGVATESVKRNAGLPSVESWTMSLKDGKYRAGTSPEALDLPSSPSTVGVFVDYHEGVVSFYDAHTATLLHSFTGCSFREKIYPYLSPGRSDRGEFSVPLVIESCKKPKPGFGMTVSSLFEGVRAQRSTTLPHVVGSTPIEPNSPKFTSFSTSPLTIPPFPRAQTNTTIFPGSTAPTLNPYQESNPFVSPWNWYNPSRGPF